MLHRSRAHTGRHEAGRALTLHVAPHTGRQGKGTMDKKLSVKLRAAGYGNMATPLALTVRSVAAGDKH